jgi:hypothetical protein
MSLSTELQFATKNGQKQPVDEDIKNNSKNLTKMT